jgi:hypothetical protein
LAEVISSMPDAENNRSAWYSGPSTFSRRRYPWATRRPSTVAVRMIVRANTEKPSTATIPDRAW